MTKVKICGLSEPNTVTEAIKDGTDFIGFVFHKSSPRHVEIEVAKYLGTFIPDNVQCVGLFVDPDDYYLTNVLHDVPLTMIQLHGEEKPERVIEIKEKFGLPVMKSISISNASDLNKVDIYEAVADWILFDAKGEDLPGGNGVPFDWSILKDYHGKKPWMLAGGLNADNVQDALSQLSPNAVDVSTGVEKTIGIKSESKILSFISAVKEA